MVEHGHAGGDVRGAACRRRSPALACARPGSIGRGHSAASVAHSSVASKDGPRHFGPQRNSVDAGMKGRVRVSLRAPSWRSALPARAAARPVGAAAAQRGDAQRRLHVAGRIARRGRGAARRVVACIPRCGSRSVRARGRRGAQLSRAARHPLRPARRTADGRRRARPADRLRGKTRRLGVAVHRGARGRRARLGAARRERDHDRGHRHRRRPHRARPRGEESRRLQPANRPTDVRDAIGHGTFVAALAAGSVTNGEGIAGFGGDAKLMIVKAGRGRRRRSTTSTRRPRSRTRSTTARGSSTSASAEPTTSTTEQRRDRLRGDARRARRRRGRQPLRTTAIRVSYPAALLQPLGSKGVGGTGLAVAASTESGARAAVLEHGHVPLARRAGRRRLLGAVSSTSPAASFPRVTLPGSLRGLYGYGSGTSFAAPEVAGAAALVMAANPSSARRRRANPQAERIRRRRVDAGARLRRARRRAAVELAPGTSPRPRSAGLKLAARVVSDSAIDGALSSLAPAVVTAGRSLRVRPRHAAGRGRGSRTARHGATDGARLTLVAGEAALKLRARWTRRGRPRAGREQAVTARRASS